MEEKTTAANTNGYVEIDLIEIWYVIKANIIKILIVAVLCAGVAFAYATFMVKPTYESTAKLYIVPNSSGSYVDWSDLEVGSYLTSDYKELILSYPVLDRVSDNLGLDMSSEELKGMLKLKNPEDTRILRITATTTSPELSRDIVNEVAKVTVKYLPVTMSSTPPNIAQKGRIQKGKVAPNVTKYTMTGFLIGVLLSIIFYAVIYFADDTIKSADDMEKAFGMRPLASVPKVSKMQKGKIKKSVKIGRKARKSK